LQPQKAPLLVKLYLLQKKYNFKGMKKLYSFLLATATTLLGLPAAPAQAQVTLTEFAPYTQNFNTLPTSTNQASFVNNSTLTGVYAQAMLTGLGAYPGGTAPVPYYGNDGAQNKEANYYSFGSAGSADRALGGIATTFIANGYPLTGTGYVALRFVNQTGRPIANLEVSYAMEQWYNSGKVDKAQVGFDYQVLTGAFTGAMEAGTWTSEPALGVAAPSTATVIASKNGNAPANRRVLTATLRGLNLAVGKEIVLRWKYVLNSETNGNGLSIDDVTVTPEAGAVTTATGTTQANIFYYDGTGILGDLNNWLSQPAQTHPTSFKANNQVFYLTTATNQVALAGNLISGTNSKLVIGDGQHAVSVAFTTTKTDVLPTTINLAAGATLEIKGIAGLLPTLGNLSSGSTVYFNTSRTDVLLNCANFGNLTLNGTQAMLARNVTVSNTLSLNNSSQLRLSVYDLTILKGGVATSDGTGYVRTNTGGALRQTVPTNNVAVLFPVGQGSYNPAWLSQASTATEDVFGVSVSDSVYTSYAVLPLAPGNADAKGKGKDSVGKGKPVTNTSTTTTHTWYVSEDDLGRSNVTMTLQSDLPTTMDPAQVLVGHYHDGNWDNDTKQKGKSTAVNAASRVYRFTRTGITGFSPFTLETAPAPLPVELVSFAASRQGGTVACTWVTASERHNDHFVLERSLDGVAFSSLAKVAGAGSSTSAQTYRWVDTTPARVLAYYRLRQVDTDSTISFSPVVTVSAMTTATLPFFAAPNPTAGPLVLTLSLPAAATVHGTVLSVVGAELLHVEQALTAGTNAIPLDLSGLPMGVYVLRLATPQGLQSLRVVKN
jgi:hypothetical protein